MALKKRKAPAGILVLDGPDACGKTTLAQEIIRKYDNVRYVHNTIRKNQWAYYYGSLALAVKWRDRGDLVIIDRWWPSENVYGPIYREKSVLPVACRMLDRAALAENILHVVGTPPVEYAVETKRASDARAGKIRPARQDFDNNVRRVVESFHDLMFGNIIRSLDGTYNDQLAAQGGLRGGEHLSEAYRADWVSYDVTKHLSPSSLGRFVSQLMTMIDLMGKRKSLGSDGHIRSGNWNRPQGSSPLIFIGDRLNPQKIHANWSFVDNAASSLFLTEALHMLRLPEKRMLFFNANDKGNDFLLRKVAEFWPQARVVALGALAYDCAAKWYDPFVIRKLPHPAYVKRFGGNKEEALAQYVTELGLATR